MYFFLRGGFQGCSETQSLAEVAELADAHGSGPCTRKGVGVRVPSSAPRCNVVRYVRDVVWRAPAALTPPSGSTLSSYFDARLACKTNGRQSECVFIHAFGDIMQASEYELGFHGHWARLAELTSN